MGAPQYKHKILEYLMERPGLIVHASELEEALGINQSQATTGINNLRKRDPQLFVAIQAIIPGRSWMYHPNQRTAQQPVFAPATPVVTQHRTLGPPKIQATIADALPPKPHVAPVGDVFEKVGQTDDREIVVKDKRGTLYKVVPL